MRRVNQLLALLLAIAMLVCFPACGSSTTQSTETQNTETTPSAETKVQETEPQKSDALAAYAKAARKTAEIEVYTLSYQITTERTVDRDRYVYQSEGVARVSTEDPGKKYAEWNENRSDSVNGTKHSYQFEEVYYAGKAVLTDSEGGKYWSETGYDPFRTQFLPTLILTPELYPAVEWSDSSEKSFRLTGADTAERWLIDGDSPICHLSDERLEELGISEQFMICDAAEILEVTAEADLDAEGRLARQSIDVRYLIDGIEEHTSCELTLTAWDGSGEKSASVKAEGIKLADLRIPALLNRAGYATEAVTWTGSQNSLIVSQAAATVLISSDSYAVGFDDKTDPGLMFSAKGELIRNDSEGQVSEKYEEYFLNGELISVSDGERKVTPGITANRMRQITVYQFFRWLPGNAAEFSSSSLTDLGDVWLIEYRGNAAMGEDTQAGICEMIFNDASTLSDVASAYSTTQMDGWISVDKITGLPVAFGIDYAGQHTIDGRNYPLSMQFETSLVAGDPHAAIEILDDLPKEEEPENKATPLFYEVTSPEGEKLWLLGTIHVGDSRTSFLPGEIYEALENADALAVECDTDSFNELFEDDEELQAMYTEAMLYSDGSYCKDHVSPETAERLDKYAKAYGMSFFMTLAPYKVTTISSGITQYYLRMGRKLHASHGVDTRLMHIAKEKGIEVWEVESVEFQMEMLGNFSDELQELELNDDLNIGRLLFSFETDMLFEAWCGGNEEELKTAIREDSDSGRGLSEDEQVLYEEYNTAVMTARNAGMLQKAEEYLSSGKTVFMAVGLAHLLAEDGLVYTLRDAGYTVTQVQYAD